MAERRTDEALEALVRLPGPDSVLAVRVGEGEYGLPVGRVGEVLRVPRLTRVPLAPPEIRGVVGVRGAVVPVLDLGRRLLGREVDAQASLARLVTVTGPGEGEPLALLVEGVPGLVDMRGLEVEEPPAETEAGLPPGTVRGVVAPPEGRFVVLLDLDRVLDLGEKDEGRGA